MRAVSCTCCFRTEAFAPLGCSISSMETTVPFCDPLSIPLWLFMTKLGFSGFAHEGATMTLGCLKEGDDVAVALASSLAQSCLPERCRL